MTDDAELRARIEAQMAARRAGTSAEDSDEPAEEDDEGAAHRLEPPRPWEAPRRTGSTSAAPRPPRPSGSLDPARPWEAGGSNRPEPADQPAPEDAVGGLRPARPWEERQATRDLAEETPAEESPTEDGSADYPWLRKEEVDLDLHGAPTWDPSEYPPESDPAQSGRGRRSLRWRRSHSEPQELAASDGEPAEPAASADAGESETDAEQRRRPSVLSRLRRRDEDDEDDDYEQFTLPEPDASFEKPWLSSLPRPTRHWGGEPHAVDEPSRAPQLRPPAPEPEPAWDVAPPVEPEAPAEVELAPEPESIAEPEPVNEPEPTPEPEPEPEPIVFTEPAPEPVAAEPEFVPVPPVAPEPEVARRRPSPGPFGAPPPGAATAGGTRRPSPGAAAQSPEQRRRPSPGPHRAVGLTGFSAATLSPHTSPFERAAAQHTTTTERTGAGHATDFARFVKAADREVDDEEDHTGPEPEAAQERAPRWRRRIIRSVVVVAIAALAALLLRTYVVQPYYIPSESMEPTLHGCPGCNDDHVLVDKISYRAHDVRAGDIVVFHRPKGDTSPESVLIKRVIALAGDDVQLRKGHVYVNGLELNEPYVDKQCGPAPTQPIGNGTTHWSVPEGDVFVMGDNRCHSDDSRIFGPIPTSSIVGRAFMIIWPLNRIGLL